MHRLKRFGLCSGLDQSASLKCADSEQVEIVPGLGQRVGAALTRR